MAKRKSLPTRKKESPIIDSYFENGVEVIVYDPYTPEDGRKSTNKGGWGRFSGVGSKFMTGRPGKGGEPV